MSVPIINIVVVFIFLLSISGVTTGRNIGYEHVTKSIKSEDGDIIDCVDMYKQPSLNHPLLKDHIIQVPSSRYSSLKDEEAFTKKDHLQQSWHKSGSCPDGTIPILRRTPNVNNLLANSDKYDPQKGSPNAQDKGVLDYSSKEINVAVGYVVDSYYGPLYGGVGNMSLWRIDVEEGEYSKNYILAANTKDNSSSLLQTMNIQNFVAAGWIVDQNTFGDDNPRLYIEWRTSNAGCYNLMCSGFMQVSKNVALGGILSNLSIFNYPDEVQAIGVHVYQEVDEGNWWVEIGNEQVGYWPKEIFNNFTQANVIVFGGEIQNKGQVGNHSSTQMGSGNNPSEVQQYGRAADISGIVVREKDNNYYDRPLQYYATIPDCYCYYSGTQGPNNGVNGSLLYYGGPGGPYCDGSDSVNSGSIFS